MDNTVNIALSRIDVLSRALDVTANNLANANTTGFKASRSLFTAYLAKQQGTNVVPGGREEVYSQDIAIYQEHRQGPLQKTGNPLDFAIQGDGFFTVRTPAGVRLTRNGQLTRSADGTLVDSSGNPVLDINGNNINLSNSQDGRPMENITVSLDGTISQPLGQTGQGMTMKAIINVVSVDNLFTLKPEGGYLLLPTTPTHRVPRERRKIRQGMIEDSNVNSVFEMTDMIRIQRDYDLNFQLLHTELTRQLNAIDKIMTEPSV